MFQELWKGEKTCGNGTSAKKRKDNGENARELALFSLKKKRKRKKNSRERKKGRKTTPNNNFPNKTHIIIRKPIIGIQQTLVDLLRLPSNSQCPPHHTPKLKSKQKVYSKQRTLTGWNGFPSSAGLQCSSGPAPWWDKPSRVTESQI